MLNLIFDNSIPLQNISLCKDGSFKGTELRNKVLEHLLLLGIDFDFYLLHNGRLYNGEDITQGDIHIIPKLCGGKGGFGSMLRAIGAQIEKTTNREACRDLSGRRLRDINEEKRLKKWIAEQAEREQEALMRKRKKLEKLNRELKHEFSDEDYTKSRLEMPEKIEEAVEQGLKAETEESSSNDKTNDKSKVSSKKKIKGSLWVDDLEGLEDSESNSESEGESPKKKIKLS